VSDQPKSNEFTDRLHADLLDSLDEELEVAFSEDRLEREPRQGAKTPADLDRKVYFRELFRLQAELVKFQDWVVRAGLKVVVLFEGRDAAGKGGIIKRVTQRLNPRVCRVAALPAERARAHAVVLPALRHPPARGRRDRALRPQLVQPRRRRAGHGLLFR
jgi:polyphosphate kinase 2 (PPK2 family)